MYDDQRLPALQHRALAEARVFDYHWWTRIRIAEKYVPLRRVRVP